MSHGVICTVFRNEDVLWRQCEVSDLQASMMTKFDGFPHLSETVFHLKSKEKAELFSFEIVQNWLSVTRW